MTYQDDCSIPSELMEQIASKGLECLPNLIRVIINTAMQAERQVYLGVGRYERGQERRRHGNSYKGRTIKTRVGSIILAVPQAREGGFYPQALEKGLRSERALLVTQRECMSGAYRPAKCRLLSRRCTRCQFHLQQNAQA